MGLPSRLIPIASLALAAAPLQAQQQDTYQQDLPSPFVTLDDRTVEGSVAISFDAGHYLTLSDYHAGGEVVTMRDFPLPDGELVDLVMRPTSVMPPGGVARVVGEGGVEHNIVPTVRTFAAFVPGRPGHSFLSITPNQLDGYIQVDSEMYFISSGELKGSALVTDAKIFPPSASNRFCNTVLNTMRDMEIGGSDRQNSTANDDVTVYNTEIFVECDDAYRAIWGNDTDAANYALTLFGAMADIYRRDVGAVLTIPSGYLRVWSVTPPWGTVIDFNSIFDIQSWWFSAANPDQFLDRDLVHVLSTPVFGGVAWLPAVCDFEFGYALSSVFGFFPQPTEHVSSDNWDLMVVSHETGHNMGSQHTFDYVPTIDCYDGSGPDDGTIMSYCHLEPGGLGQVGMRFHERVQLEQIRPTMDASGCLDLLSFPMGDYDLDNAHTASDLAAFDSVVNQGFFSLAVNETFDLNGDGNVDASDRVILESLIAGEVELALAVTPDPLTFGGPITLSVTKAAPGETVHFLYSTQGVGTGPCPGKVGGMCIDILSPNIAAARVTDGSGFAQVMTTVPLGFPTNFVALQVVARRGAGGADSVKSLPKTVDIN